MSLKFSSQCTCKIGDAVKAPPTVLIWCLHFAAQHYNHLGQYDRALELSQEAIDHTPTVVELYMVKADILKVSFLFWFIYYYRNYKCVGMLLIVLLLS